MENIEKQPQYSGKHSLEDINNLAKSLIEEQRLGRDLEPQVRNEIEELIKEKGADEKEISEISERLKDSGSPYTGDKLRQEAIIIWKEDLISKKAKKQAKEKLSGQTRAFQA